jgi:hypothetical protein
MTGAGPVVANCNEDQLLGIDIYQLFLMFFLKNSISCLGCIRCWDGGEKGAFVLLLVFIIPEIFTVRDISSQTLRHDCNAPG